MFYLNRIVDALFLLDIVLQFFLRWGVILMSTSEWKQTIRFKRRTLIKSMHHRLGYV